MPYLQQRFKGVIRVEQGHSEWTLEGGFAEFTPVPVTEAMVDGGVSSAPVDGAELEVQTGEGALHEAEPELQDAGIRVMEAEAVVQPSPSDPEEDSMTGSLF